MGSSEDAMKKARKKLRAIMAPGDNFASERKSLDSEYENMRGNTQGIGLGTDNYSKKKKLSANMAGGPDGWKTKFAALMNKRKGSK